MTLFQIHQIELSGESTAELPVNCLKRTLGLTEEEIREKLEHGVFDFVYEEPKNRT